MVAELKSIVSAVKSDGTIDIGPETRGIPVNHFGIEVSSTIKEVSW